MIEFILRAYIYIQQHFMLSPIIIIAMIILIISSILGILISSIILIMDSFYRPNVPQYPFNLFLDKLMPLILIMMPSILILCLNNETSYIAKIGYIICVHLIIIIPIMLYWSKNRNWFSNEKHMNLWSHPGVYLNITIAMMYPAIWCLFLSLIRYLRLGSTINVADYITLNWALILISLSLLFILYRRTFFWFLLLLKDIRIFFWDKFLTLINSLLIIGLKYKTIFTLCEILYKISFIWITFVINDSAIYRKYPPNMIKRLIHKIYLFPIYIYLFIMILMLLEIILTKGYIYYSLYLLLLFMLIRPLFYFLNTFNGPFNEWINICCISNYIYNNWTNAYYPKQFWLSFQQFRIQYFDEPYLTPEEKNHISFIIQQWKYKHEYDRRVNFHIYLRLIKSPKTKIIHRIRLLYYRWTNIK